MIRIVMQELHYLHYQDGEKRYILHPLGLNIGEKVLALHLMH